MQRIVRLVFTLALITLLAGCAKKEMAAGRMLWPLPPDEPRLEFKGVYFSELDLKDPKRRKTMAMLTGEEAEALFKTPMGIASDNQGKVYVADMHDRNLRVYDFDKRTVEYFAKESPFHTPLDVAVNVRGDGRIYVSDIGTNQVLVFSPDRRPLFAFGGQEQNEKLTYLAINNRLGRLYVTDGKGHEIKVFDLDGNPLFSFGGGGVEEGQFYGPRGLAIDSKDRVFVADGLNARIQVFDADGAFLHGFGVRGDEPFAFDSPRGIAIDVDDNVYIADTKKSYFHIFTPEGQLLTTVGSDKPGRNLTDFMTPGLVDVDPYGRVFVTDPLNRRFVYWQYFSPDYRREHPVTAEDLQQLKTYLEELDKAVKEKKAGTGGAPGQGK